MPHRERYLFVCTNRREATNPKGSCAQKGSEELVKALKTALHERGLARTLRVCSSSCLDMCEAGAAIVVEPNHVVYGDVKLSDVSEIADALSQGRVVERLIVAPPEQGK